MTDSKQTTVKIVPSNMSKMTLTATFRQIRKKNRKVVIKYCGFSTLGHIFGTQPKFIPHSFFEGKSVVTKYISGTKQKRLLYFIQKHKPQRGQIYSRSIRQFDLIRYQFFALEIAMATLRRHRFNEAYLPAHCLLRLLF